MAIGNFKKIAVLAQFSPDMFGGGAEVLREILSDYPTEKIIWINTNKQVVSKRWWRLDLKVYETPINFQRGFHIKAWKFIYKYLLRYIEQFYNVNFISNIIKKNEIELLWVVSDYPILNTVFSLTKRLKMPYHVSIHDDPSFSSRIFNNPMPQKVVGRYFNGIVKNSNSMDVISKNMSDLYKSKFGKDSIVITKGFNLDDLNRLNKSIASKKYLKVLMAGTSINTSPWPDIMFEALDYFNKKELHPMQFFAFDIKLTKYMNAYTTVCHNMSQAEHKLLVESMDIGYANDPLDHSEEFAVTSMPTKVITYIAYGIPFIYHGPAKAAIGAIIKENSLGVHVCTNELSDLINGFNELIKNYEFYSKNCVCFANDNYDINKIRASLYKLISSN